jgi:hypothetical protein
MSEPLTDAQLGEVRKAYERMTPGPWETRSNVPYSWPGRGLVIFRGRFAENETIGRWQNEKYGNTQANVDGIVALVNAFPALLALLEQRTAALRLAEWNCAPGSGFCPVCHEPEEPMTYGNGKRVKGGHKRSCKLRAALLPSEGTQK